MGRTEFDRPFCCRSRRLSKRSDIGETKCPLWVISGHTDELAPCPLYPQYRTFVDAGGMSEFPLWLSKAPCSSEKIPCFAY